MDSTRVRHNMPGRCLVGVLIGLTIVALELPFKVLVWQDAGETWLSYIDFRWLAKRYGAGPEEVCLITDIAVMIDGIARKATSPP
jgi:hypothetical protein